MRKFYSIVCMCLLLLLCSNCDSDKPVITTWTVTFNSNGGSLIDPLEMVGDGMKIKKPVNPQKLNVTFGGWFVDNTTFQHEWDFTKNVVVSDTVLYAKWVTGLPAWTVTFDSNGGSTIESIRNVESGTKISKPTSPTKIKFLFDGWFTDNTAFTNEWNFGENQVINDTTLYARWSPDLEPERIFNNLKGLVPDCADPYILKYDDVYYLYGTGGNDGIRVYRSDNMVDWSKAVGVTKGYALHKDAVWGEKWFWAPEVYFINNKFYMFYSAEEKISVAESSSPLGPFVQSSVNRKPFHENTKEIDTHLFIDDDGKMYLYFVRFTNGNEIWAAELNDDLRSIKENTLVKCFGASQSWENSSRQPYPSSKVNEGPFILKHNGWYYLTYSANHYQNPDYGVGYAISKNPLKGWVKYSGNPILTGNSITQGVGHHSFVTVSEGCQYIVYHSHLNMTTVQPRKMGIDYYDFVPSTPGSPDILRVYGPTTTPQNLCHP